MKTKHQRPLVVTIGGNAIIKKGEEGSTEDELENLRLVFGELASYITDTPLVITHGNGPMVGEILLRSELAKEKVPPLPLYVCGAHSQAEVGLLVQQILRNELSKIGVKREIATVVTQVVVSGDDQSFSRPEKPIGFFYSEAEAERLETELGWQMREDSHRGYRRVVPSPKPRRVVEMETIKRLVEEGVITICGGGGGVPVVEEDGALKGVDAVVDKDHTTTLIANSIGAERIINITQVDAAYLDFGGSNQRRIDIMTVEKAEEYLKKGEFQQGSMAPKIESAIEFIDAGGREVLITSPASLGAALSGISGTRIIP